jgi:predicted dehydrogenase
MVENAKISRNMRQLLQDIGTGETRLLEVPMPVVSAGHLLVRTRASFVSVGTERSLVEFAGKSLAGKAMARPDLVKQVLRKVRRDGILPTIETVTQRLSSPVPLGYSLAGTVQQAGPDAGPFKPGDRVACVGAGYANHAEYALIPKNLCVVMPDDVSFEEGSSAALAAIALHALHLGNASMGESCCVIGLGIIGHMAAQLAKASGMSVLTVDIDADRVAKAENLGLAATHRECAEETSRAFTHSRGFDLVIIAADADSNDPVEFAAQVARDRGYVVALGAVKTELPRRAFYDKELTFRVSRSYGPGRYDPEFEAKGHDYPLPYVRWTEQRNVEAVLDMIAQGQLRISPLITHRFPIEDGPKAYDLISGRLKEPFLGVVLTYAGEFKDAERISFSGAPAPETGSLGLGVIGAGSFARGILLPAFKDQMVSFVGVAGGRGLSARTAADRFKFAYCAGSEEQVLSDESIRLLLIGTPHNLHARQVVAALNAGKHVFVEKPLCLTQNELDAIRDAVRKAKTMLMVGFNRRFARQAIALRDFFAAPDGPMIAHYRINAGLLEASHWAADPERGGGRLLGECCHFVDWMIWALPRPPAFVTATSLHNREDSFAIQLRCADGSLGRIDYITCGDPSQGKERIEIHRSGRSASLEDFHRLEMFKNGRRSVERAWLRADKGHAAEVAAFVDAARNGDPAPTPFEDLELGLRILFAAQESIRSRREIQL